MGTSNNRGPECKHVPHRTVFRIVGIALLTSLDCRHSLGRCPWVSHSASVQCRPTLNKIPADNSRFPSSHGRTRIAAVPARRMVKLKAAMPP